MKHEKAFHHPFTTLDLVTVIRFLLSRERLALAIDRAPAVSDVVVDSTLRVT